MSMGKLTATPGLILKIKTKVGDIRAQNGEPLRNQLSDQTLDAIADAAAETVLECFPVPR